MFSCIFDLFYPRPPKPTFDLFFTYCSVFGASCPLGRLWLLDSCSFSFRFLDFRGSGKRKEKPLLFCGLPCSFSTQVSGKKKAHKDKFFCLVGLGTTPGLSRGFHLVCQPGTNPGFLLILHSGSPAKPGFVPGTNPVRPRDNPGDEGGHRKFM